MLTRDKVKEYLYKIGANRSWSVLPHASVSLAANGAGSIVIITPSRFDFLIKSISGRSTGTYLLNFLGTGKSELLNNKPLAEYIGESGAAKAYAEHTYLSRVNELLEIVGLR